MFTTKSFTFNLGWLGSAKVTIGLPNAEDLTLKLSRLMPARTTLRVFYPDDSGDPTEETQPVSSASALLLLDAPQLKPVIASGTQPGEKLTWETLASVSTLRITVRLADAVERHIRTCTDCQSGLRHLVIEEATLTRYHGSQPPGKPTLLISGTNVSHKENH